MAAGGRHATMLGVGWEDVGKIHRALNNAQKTVKLLEGGLVRWFGPGGSLTRKAANHAAAYIKKAIQTNEYAWMFPDLHPAWYARKQKLGLSLFKGIATESMVSAIGVTDLGGGKFRVGIPKGSKSSEKIGNWTDINKYAQQLEWGGTFATSSSGQPPRPFFSVGFVRWVNAYAPQLKTEVSNLLIPRIDALLRDFNSSGNLGSMIDEAVIIDYEGLMDINDLASEKIAVRYDTYLGKKPTNTGKAPTGTPMNPNRSADTMINSVIDASTTSITNAEMKRIKGIEIVEEFGLKFIRDSNWMWDATAKMWRRMGRA